MSEINEDGLASFDPAVRTGFTFLSALFAREDWITFRPIEAWTEEGKKQSKVIYGSILYRHAAPVLIVLALRNLLETSDEHKANIFFGVCPRFGDRGRYELACQIRKVRALWCDIDHITVEEALALVAKAGLPAPSIVVNSGHGVHLYWLLDEPYVIDDVGDPPPVETEWIRSASGNKKARKYIVQEGDKVYLGKRCDLTRLSAKALHAQDILAGIAKAIGGDHTTDLSRLLRVPGFANRKDQRNGKDPVPTALVECHPSKRYPLAVFEPFATPSVEAERAKKIAAMPLPKARSVCASKSDKLNDLIAASAIAEPGTRSEADFAVCCYAIRNGIAQEEGWNRVEHVGKFAEQGRRYFELTWENAEHQVRSEKLDRLQFTLAREAPPSMVADGDEHAANPDTSPPVETSDGEMTARPMVAVHPDTEVRFTLRNITDRLLADRNCFNRADQLIIVNKGEIAPILHSHELAGLLSQFVEFLFVDDKGNGEYKPLPPAYGNTWLNNRVELGRLPQIKLFSRNPIYTDDWRLVAPGFDHPTGIYYAGPAVEARDGTKHVDTLLKEFCFHKPADRANYLGILLTMILMPRFIGSKPAALFNGNQPLLGKSILAQIISILRDGRQTETATFNPNDEEFEKRLGALVRRGDMTLIIDNAKNSRGNQRIESACLERSITDPIVSFRLLGYSVSIRAENSYIFCITANSANVGRDIATRSVVINLYLEGNPERRTFEIDDPEDYALKHRFEILGELIGMVERWKAAGMPLAQVKSRFNKKGWGHIVGGVLETCGQSDFLVNAGDATTFLDDVRREFGELVFVLAAHPQGTWTAAELVAVCGKEQLLVGEVGEGSPRSLATKMGTLAGRYIGERFPMGDGREAVFHRSSDRKGNIYRVGIEEVPNLEDFAEPLPNHANAQRSAP